MRAGTILASCVARDLSFASESWIGYEKTVKENLVEFFVVRLSIRLVRSKHLHLRTRAGTVRLFRQRSSSNSLYFRDSQLVRIFCVDVLPTIIFGRWRGIVCKIIQRGTWKRRKPHRVEMKNEAIAEYNSYIKVSFLLLILRK